MAEMNGFASYQSMMITVGSALSDLADLCETMKMDKQREELEAIRKKLEDHHFSVGIMGEFKRGKSTVINSLLAKEIMPADILPCSATMNRVTYDLRPHVQLIMRDGSTRDIAVEELADYVTKLTEAHESRAAEVEEAVVYYPCRFCQNGVDIIDTPGLNDDERMNRIAEEIIPRLDAVIMVITPDNPFSMSEAEFVRTKLMASDLGRLIFVVNKIDTIRRASDRVRVVESIRQKIEKSVMQKMADVYGEGSEEYQDALRKMGRIRIFPFSALDALEGKLAGDQELIEKSGTCEFEAALMKMLTEDRGALELATPLNAIARIAVEVVKTVDVRRNALRMSAEEFEKNRQKMLEEIKTIRASKAKEKNRLRGSEAETKAELRGVIAEFYPQLAETLKLRLEEACGGIDLSTLHTEEGMRAAGETLRGAVSTACKDQFAIISEKVQHRLSVAAGKEIVRTGKFVSEATSQLDSLNEALFKRPGMVAEMAVTGVDAFASSMITGFGSLVAGYKNAGIKGALVGGGIGLVAMGVVESLLVAVQFLGPAAWLATALAGTLASKFATRLIFSKDIAKRKLDDLRRAIEEGIDKMIDELKVGRELEIWSEKQTEERYDAVIRSLEEEIERLLSSTEGSIDVIRRELTENEVRRAQLEKQYTDVLKAVNDLTEKDIAAVAERVRAVLESM